MEEINAMAQSSGTSRTAKVTIRLRPDVQRKLEETAKTRGYSCPSAFLRAAIEHEINGRTEFSGVEERIAASFDRVCRDVFRVSRGQQALFALVDTLTKTFLTCVPEPPADVKRQAVARAKERYEALMKTAGRAMVGDGRAAMLDLVELGGREPEDEAGR
jgi:predicted DNA-binding protein